MIDPSWWDLVEERGVDPDLVTIEWGYWNGPAECRVTLGERTEAWQATSNFVTPLQRQEIPGMLIRRLSVERPVLATSHDWCIAFGTRVMDPDGWDRCNFEASWFELIDADEFLRRCAKSTVDSREGLTPDEARARLRGARTGL